MTIADPADTAVTVYFEVHVDGHDLGAFTGVRRPRRARSSSSSARRAA